MANEKRTIEYQIKVLADLAYKELAKISHNFKKPTEAAKEMTKYINKFAKDAGVPLDILLNKLEDIHMKMRQMKVPSGDRAGIVAYGKFSVQAAVDARQQRAILNIKEINKEEAKSLQIQQKQTAEKQKQAKVIKEVVAVEDKYGKILKQQAMSIASMGLSGFGQQVNMTKKLLMDLTRQYGISVEEAAKWAKGMHINGKVVAAAADEINNKFEGLSGALRRTFGKIQNYMSTAFGVSMAMILFKAYMAITQFFTKSLDKAKEFEKELRELKVQEAILSNAGIEISMAELDEILNRLVEKFKYFEKADVSNVFTQVINLTKYLGLSLDQMEQLTQVLLTAQLKTGEIGQDPSTFLNAYIDRNDRTLTRYGASFTKAKIDAKALAMNLAESSDQISEADRHAALLQILFEQIGKDSELVLESIEGTNEGIDATYEKGVSKLQLSWGKLFRVIEIEWKKMIIDSLEYFNTVSTFLKLGVVQVSAAYFTMTQIIRDFWAMNMKSASEYYDMHKTRLAEMLDESLTNTDEVSGKNAREAMGLGLKIEEGDTPTNPYGGGLLGGDTAQEDAADKAEDAAEDMHDIMKDMLEKEQDFRLDSAREWEDYYKDLDRMREDYEHDKSQITQEANNDLAKKEADYRNKELEAELKFQEDMRQLREKFLFDLEDALHERDARQVIRLQKQYAMDVTNKTNEYELDKQKRQRDIDEERKEARDRMAERLAELEYEYEMRKQRAEEDFLLSQQRAAQDHKIDMDRRTAELQDKLKLWRDYYQKKMALAAQGESIIQQIQDPNRRGGVRMPGSAGSTGGTRSLNNFIPTSSISTGGAVRGTAPAGGGSATIAVTLSPDLEARVVNNAMNGVAEVITSAARGGVR